MALQYIDHFNIRAPIEKLDAVKNFYVDILGMTVGERPPFQSVGYWLYCGNRACLHLVVDDTRTGGGAAKQDTLDHIAFQAEGLEEMRERLSGSGVEYEERRVPDRNVHQIFMRDPSGLKIELDYDT